RSRRKSQVQVGASACGSKVGGLVRMTPPPITFAGKGSPSTGHRAGVRKRTAPVAPRRVSGPTGGRTEPARNGTSRAKTTSRAKATARATAAAAPTRASAAAPTTRATAARAATGTRARPTTRTHRRRLIPRLAPLAPRRTSTRARPAGPLPARAIAYVRALPDHSLLDRIVRGRTWIAMLGVMLVGIVAMQVEELKLGASVGRALSQNATLQSRNQLLRASVSALSD